MLRIYRLLYQGVRFLVFIFFLFSWFVCSQTPYAMKLDKTLVVRLKKVIFYMASYMYEEGEEAYVACSHSKRKSEERIHNQVKLGCELKKVKE